MVGPSTEGPDGPVQSLRSMVTAYRLSQAIYLMVRLGVANELEKGPRTSSEIAGACGAEDEPMHRLLRSLVPVGLLSVKQGRFALTPAALPLCDSAPNSIANWVSTVSREQFTAWSGLEKSVRTGGAAFDHVHGISFWRHLETDREAARLYDLGMAESVREACAFLREVRGFDDVGTVCDLGGGSGAALVSLLSHEPRLRGMLVDVPAVVEGAAAPLAAAGVADRCSLVAGSFLDRVPSGADVYLLCRVLADWDDASVLRLLTNCRAAMEPADRLWVLGGLVGEDSAGPGMLDLHLMVLTGGGERTETQTRALLERAGFGVTDVVHADHGRVSLVEATVR